jgi:hypothetical protein
VSDSFERRARVTTKPPVPKATERPLMGLTSTKNFIAANAIENILAKPPAARGDAPAVAKKDYGRVPDYLRTIKAQIAAEKAQMEAYEREQQDSTRGVGAADDRGRAGRAAVRAQDEMGEAQQGVRRAVVFARRAFAPAAKGIAGEGE